ncbi:MAG: prepilin-type N-terminal cleavage/methylation domain-containing protein [Gemmatimonadota bacterium]|nr:MAG: prepilin-type N-terminal cleavage/methylation domain-containing protein [Gemmatimonadota bacterium]
MRRESGFTLISVLIAMVLLSVGIMALARAGGEVIAARSTASIKVNALAIARAHIERIRAQPPQDVKAEAPVQVDESGLMNSGGAYTRTVIVDALDPTLIRVKVQVDYPRATLPVELVTLIYIPPVPT